MDEFEALQELQEDSGVDTTIRQPLASAEDDNEITSRRSQTREVSSRYKSPTPSNNSRRYQSPNLTRAINPTSQLGSSKRALSAERKRPSSRPTSPSSRPSTPFSDTSTAEQQLSSSKKIGSSSRLPEVLWPSTKRSLSVSIQSDSVSVPDSTKEKEKPVTHALADRTLKHSSNMTTIATRKSTPERKRSPLKGKLHHNQSENSRPVVGLQARLIDQHRWPSRAGGGRLSTLLTRNVDISSDSFGKSSTCSPSSSSSSPISISAIQLRRLSGEDVSDDVGSFSSSSSLSSTEIPLRRQSSEGVFDNVRTLSSSSSLSSTGIPSRRLSAEGVGRSSSPSSLSPPGVSPRRQSSEGVPGVGRSLSPSSLSTTGMSPRRASSEGVSDNVGRFLSSSSLSRTGIPSLRLSTEGISDNVGRFLSSSSLSSTGIPSTLSTKGVLDNIERFSSSSFLSSTGIPLSEGVSDNVERFSSSSSLASTGTPSRRLSAEGVGRSSSPSSLSPPGVSSRRQSSEGVSGVGRSSSPSSLSTTRISPRRPSSGGVLDNVRIFPSSSSLSSTGIPSRRLSAEGIPRNLQKNSGDSSGKQSVFDEDHKAGGLSLKSVDDIFLREPKEDTLSSSRRASLGALPARLRLMPGQRIPSPNRTPVSKEAPGPLRTTLSAEGVSDNVERFSSSSSLSSTGIPSTRLSSEGIFDSAGKFSNSSSLSSTAIPSRRLSAEGIPRNLQKSSGDSSGKQSVFEEDHRAGGLCLKSADDIFLMEPKEDTLSSSRRASLGALPARSKLVPGQRLSSPNRTPVSKGARSPLRTRLSTEGVSDHFERLSSSSSISCTGTPSTRVSSEGVLDNVERFSSSSSLSSTSIPSRRLSNDGIPRNLQKSSGDSPGKQSVFEEDHRAGGLCLKSADDIFLMEPKEHTSSSSRRASLGALPARSRLVPGQRLLSPSRTPVSKGTRSPLRTRRSTEGVSDNFERLSSSSSISSTGTPSTRVSSEGVLDNVERFSSSSSLSSTGLLSRRLSNESIPRNLQKSSGDSSGKQSVFDEDHREVGLRLKSVDDIFHREPKEDKLCSSRRASLGALSARSRLLPGQQLSSPNRTPVSKGALSPLRTRLSAVGVSDDKKYSSSSPLSSTGAPSKRVSAEGIPRNLQKSSGDFSGKQSVFDEDHRAGGLCLKSVDDVFLREPKEDTLSSSRRASLDALPVRSRLVPGQRLSSPDRTLVSKGAPSPLRTRMSAEGVSDNFERFSSSSSPSTTGTPSPRLSSDGVFDSVGKFSSSSSLSSTGIPSRRLSTEGIPRNLMKSSDDDRADGLHLKSVDDIFLRELKEDTLSSSRRASLGALPARSRLVPAQRLPSPIRTTVSKGAPSPLRTRPSTPTSRGASPSRVRPSSPSKQSTSATSVFSFIPDIMNCKKTSQLLEDAHQLRLLHNRYLQWRFTNAQADATMYFKKINAEESLYNVWQTNLQLWDSVITKRIELQQLKLELKVNLMVREQFSYLEEWTLHEREHSASLVGAITAFKASTLRVPVIGGAKADIDSLMAAMGSAVNIMHTTVSSIYSVLPKVEDMTGWVSELAELAGHEKASLSECDALLTSTATMQVREYSLRTQQIQLEQDLRSTRNPILWPTTS